MKYIIYFLQGMVIGIANIIPGLSGGTMAILVGAYEKLISVIGNFFKNLKKTFIENMKYIIPIGLGILVGVVLFSRLLSFLLENYKMPTQFAFIGLVLGSLPLLFRKALKNKDETSENKKTFKKTYLIPLLITFLIGLSLSILEAFGIAGTEVESFDINIINIILLFIYGFIAAGTMVIPGISGSFILLLLGVYSAILSAISTLNIIVLIPFGIGVVAGILILAKLIDILLNKFPNGTYFAIIGFIIGAVPAIFPGFSLSLQGLASIITLLLGFIIAFRLSKLSKD